MAINIDCVDWQSTGDAYVSIIQRRLPGSESELSGSDGQSN